MKIFRNRSDKKSVMSCLLVAILSAGIFLLHETGPASPTIPQEAFPVAMGFQGNQPDIPAFYSLISSAKSHEQSRNSQCLVFKILGKKLEDSLSSTITKSERRFTFAHMNATQHFRSRSLTSEDPFSSFS